jgi:predicted nuclease of predicted toxin-antitoxin system
VKFLVDNQLPAALARFIESREGYILISKDGDFLHLILQPSATAGLVWVELGIAASNTSWMPPTGRGTDWWSA